MSKSFLFILTKNWSQPIRNQGITWSISTNQSTEWWHHCWPIRSQKDQFSTCHYGNQSHDLMGNKFELILEDSRICHRLVASQSESKKSLRNHFDGPIRNQRHDIITDQSQALVGAFARDTMATLSPDLYQPIIIETIVIDQSDTRDLCI